MPHDGKMDLSAQATTTGTRERDIHLEVLIWDSEVLVDREAFPKDRAMDMLAAKIAHFYSSA